MASSRKLGEFKNGIVIYSVYEALYLEETKKAELFFKDKKIKVPYFLKKIKQKHLLKNYLVFRDLTKKGYIVKTGLKFGAEFRVYNKKDKHAKWLCQPFLESNKISWSDFSAKNRIAHSTAKKLLLALVDKEEDINYYEVSWTKP